MWNPREKLYNYYTYIYTQTSNRKYTPQQCAHSKNQTNVTYMNTITTKFKYRYTILNFMSDILILYKKYK